MNLRQMERFMHEGENDTASWRDIEQVRERWPGKLAVKGVMSAADARTARDAGADAIELTALGASACLVGRPAFYGVVTGDQPGISAILRTLADEAATALAFTGATRLDDLNPDMVVGATDWRPASPRAGSRSRLTA